MYTAEQIAAMSDDELRRVIAGLTGYRYEGFGALTQLSNATTQGVLIFPDRREKVISEYPEYSWWQCDYIPNWPGDANAALGLAKDTGCSVSIHTLYSKWIVTIADKYTGRSNKSSARAICEAWVLWKQAQS